MISQADDKDGNYLLYLLLPYLLLVIVHIALCSPMQVPIIWPDEFAYLFFAKYMAGIEHMQNIPRVQLTGSFGYSVLLSPIMMLVQDPQKAYSWILILNSVVGSTLYIGLFLLLKQLFNVGNNRAFWISFVVSLYPAYLLQTDVALTDAITPALFVFGVLLFNLFVNKKTLLLGIAFALAAGYLNWVHVRMLPFDLIAISYLTGLIYYRRMPFFQAGISIIIMIIMMLLGVIIGDHLTFAISGNDGGSNRITTSLIQVSEMILIFSLLGAAFYFVLRKHYLLMIFTVLGLIGGILASTSFSALWLVPAIGVIIISLLLFSKSISLKYGILSFLILNVISAFTYFVLPDFGYYQVVLERIVIWFVNASGSLFYAMFSTYGLFLAGLVFMLRQVWNDALIEVPVAKHTHIFDDEKVKIFSGTRLLNNPNSLTILFLTASAFLMIFITIFPSKLGLSHYRADHLFYGRYVEVILSGFMAIGIYKLITSDIKEFIIAALSSWVFFVILTFVMIIAYNNIIPSELSFRSVLSFFPLRAVLSNINIMLFFIAALTVSVVTMIAFRFNPRYGKVVLASAFLSFTAFTYIYVNYYHQVEKKQRNKLVKYINENFPDETWISYDRKIFTETSQNGLSYLWLMPKFDFNFFGTSGIKANTNLIIAGANYGIDNNALLLNIEHDGNDHLWIKSNTLNNAQRNEMVPSFYDIPLNKKYVGGVLRKGFYDDKWINGKVEIATFVNKPDSIFKLEIDIASSNPKPHNLIIWLDNKELFNQNINYGTWRYTLSIKSDSLLDKLNFKLFSDLIRDKVNKNKLVGIVVSSFIIRESKLEQPEIHDKDIAIIERSTEANLSIYPRRNIDMSLLDLSPGDTVEIPFVIKNNSSKAVRFYASDSVFATYKWSDFVFKKAQLTQIIDKPINKLILPGKEIDLIIKLIVPIHSKKYFLEFGFLSKNRVIINQIDKREFIINLKPNLD